jgi:hypothetical protein
MKKEQIEKLYTMREIAEALRVSKAWVLLNYRMWASDYGLETFEIGNKLVMTETNLKKLISIFRKGKAA